MPNPYTSAKIVTVVKASASGRWNIVRELTKDEECEVSLTLTLIKP
jgi:hypothetical protein